MYLGFLATSSLAEAKDARTVWEFLIPDVVPNDS